MLPFVPPRVALAQLVPLGVLDVLELPVRLSMQSKDIFSLAAGFERLLPAYSMTEPLDGRR